MLDQKRVECAKGYLEELYAILLLEYHNKNHLQLGCKPKQLNEMQRRLVKGALLQLDPDRVLP